MENINYISIGLNILDNLKEEVEIRYDEESNSSIKSQLVNELNTIEIRKSKLIKMSLEDNFDFKIAAYVLDAVKGILEMIDGPIKPSMQQLISLKNEKYLKSIIYLMKKKYPKIKTELVLDILRQYNKEIKFDINDVVDWIYDNIPNRTFIPSKESVAL